MAEFSFTITHKDSATNARTGIINTAHGNIQTPYLVPVATRARINALSKEDLASLPLQALLANTYHLHFMPPGDLAIKSLGGLHGKMDFQKPIFTDSGGFQALSLGLGRLHKLRKIGFFPGKNPIELHKDEKNFVKMTEKGIFFTSTYDEKTETFIGPKESMDIQSNLGADIIMAFDQCNPPGQTEEETRKSMELSHLWEKESLVYKDPKQALYGIIHGGAFPELRKESAKIIASLPFEGIAIGGSLGNTKEDMYRLLSITMSELSSVENKPKHMLGIGWIDDIFECVERGIDTFDCVHTTRIARHGALYVSPIAGGSPKNKFKIKIKKDVYISDDGKVDPWCTCSTCKQYNRKQLCELCKKKDPEYGRLATIHNISFMDQLLKEIRSAIKENRFSEMKKLWLKK